MSGTSNVGGSGVYEAGDQRNPPNSEIPQADRYHEGQPNSHKANDSSSSPTQKLSLLRSCRLLMLLQRTSALSQTS